MLAPFRHRGVGAKILQEILRDISPLGKLIYLHAQLRAVPFYERHGFCTVGESFTEAGLAHFEMRIAKPAAAAKNHSD